MSSNFPVDIDVFPTLVDNVDTIHAEEWNDLANSIIAIENSIGARISFLQTTGEIKLWASTIASIPSGWLHCDGAAVSRNTFANLFAEIGTTYGVGDGSTTFNLPDTRDIFPVGTREDSDGIAKTRLEGILIKTGGSLTQPATTSSNPINGNVNSGPNQNLEQAHTHTFTPPFIALIYMIKT